MSAERSQFEKYYGNRNPIVVTDTGFHILYRNAGAKRQFPKLTTGKAVEKYIDENDKRNIQISISENLPCIITLRLGGETIFCTASVHRDETGGQAIIFTLPDQARFVRSDLSGPANEAFTAGQRSAAAAYSVTASALEALEGEASGDRRREYAGIARRGVRQMYRAYSHSDRYMAGLLDAGSDEAATVNLTELIQSLFSHIKHFVPDDIKIEYAAPPTGCWATLNPPGFARMVLILLTFAYKNSKNGAIQLTFPTGKKNKPDGDTLTLHIGFDGPRELAQLINAGQINQFGGELSIDLKLCYSYAKKSGIWLLLGSHYNRVTVSLDIPLTGPGDALRNRSADFGDLAELAAIELSGWDAF